MKKKCCPPTKKGKLNVLSWPDHLNPFLRQWVSQSKFIRMSSVDIFFFLSCNTAFQKIPKSFNDLGLENVLREWDNSAICYGQKRWPWSPKLSQAAVILNCAIRVISVISTCRVSADNFLILRCSISLQAVWKTIALLGLIQRLSVVDLFIKKQTAERIKCQKNCPWRKL